MVRKQHALLSWHHDANGGQTARQLFEVLDVSDSGFVALHEVAARWPGAGDSPELQRLLQRLACGEDKLSWRQFRSAVRLWRSLPAADHRPPSLRRYLAQSAAETWTGMVTSLVAAEAASLAAATAGEVAWTQLCPLGAVAATLALLPLDSSNMHPRIKRDWADYGPSALVNLGPTSRQALFLAASAAAGVMLAPAAPVLAATIGDPKSKGYGPLAVAALATGHFVGQAATLAVLPDSLMEVNTSKIRKARASCAFFSAFGGGLIAAVLGLTAARSSDRPGAKTTILLSCGLLSTHAWATAVLAAACHDRGEPEPLQPALSPALQLMAVLQRIMPAP